VPRKKKLIIEIRANEYEMRDANPNVPWAAAEIAEDAVRCREVGASIIHFHARKSDGAPAFGSEAYREAVAAIRERSDILIHTTLGRAGQGGLGGGSHRAYRQIVGAGLSP
jgi:3-keto-5-aminohexanoate cleavage enzyme